MTKTSGAAVCERIKSVRKQLGLSRKDFENKLGISASTLRAWESGTLPLSNKSTKRFIEALDKAGLVVNKDWLLEGFGLMPRPKHGSAFYNAMFTSIDNDNFTNWNNDIQIFKEIDFFERTIPDAITMVINDDAMAPVYNMGEYIGGIKRSAAMLCHYLFTDCIVGLSDGQVILRRIARLTGQNCVSLSPLNANSKADFPYHYDCKVEFFAQVIWHRKHEIRCSERGAGDARDFSIY